MDIKEKWVNEQIQEATGELEKLKEQLTQVQQAMRMIQVNIIERQGRINALQEILEELKRKNNNVIDLPAL